MKKEIILQDLVTDRGGTFTYGCLYFCTGVFFILGCIAMIIIASVFSY